MTEQGWFDFFTKQNMKILMKKQKTKANSHCKIDLELKKSYRQLLYY